MSALLERLRQGPPLLCDGAMGTQLFARGVKPGECPERVNLEHPDWLRDIARSYRQAGAEILTANSFGASPLKLAPYDLQDRTAELNAAAVAAVRAEADGAWVAGDLGPCGAILKPYGEAEPAAVKDSFAQQCQALAEAGVDLFLVETMIDLAEARLAVQAAREVAPQLPVLASMTFDPTPRGFFTVMGVTVAQAVEGLGEAGAAAVGANCGQGVATMVELARALVEASALPVIVQSNAGLPELVGGEAVYGEGPEQLAAGVAQMLAAGVRVVGGCCGTTPAHIAALRRCVDGFAGGGA